MMIEGSSLLLILAVFLVAGLVKGVVGLGLPTVSLALLAVKLDITLAMTLILLPSLTANLWQGFSGGHALAILRRLWPFLLTATLAVGAGAVTLTRLDPGVASALLGLLLIVYGLSHLAGMRFRVPATSEGWLGAVAGTANGVFTGITGSFVVPGVMYLQAPGLPRDMLVQAMGLLFVLSTLALGVSLQGFGIVSADLLLWSLFAVVPALTGMALGQKIRGRVSEAAFRRLLFLALTLLGGYLLVQSVMGAAMITS